MKRALIVGINYNEQPEMKLRGCINDANNIYHYLIDHKGYKPENMTLMTDEPANKSTDKYPRKTYIMKHIDRLVAATKSGDTLFVHFSSHGTEIRDTNGDELDGKDSAIVTCRGSLIVDDELKASLVNKMPKGSKLRVLMDLCHSGTCLDLPYNWRDGKFSKESADVTGAPDCIMISGTYDAFVSYDSYIAGNYSGAFTYNILSILKTMPNCTWQDLLSVLCYKIKKSGYNQIPQLSMGAKELLTNKIDI